MRAYPGIILLLINLLSFNAYATDELSENDEENDEENIYINNQNNALTYDPYEKFNRTVFKFNKQVDTVILKPTSKLYNFVIPKFFRDRMGNFLQNLTEPVNLVNGFLQLDTKKSTTAATRFLTNSFLGLGGIHDVATEAGLKYSKTGFGETLKTYKVKTGPYLVLPIIGSSSVRDTFGFTVDTFTDPFNHILKKKAAYSRTALFVVDKRSSLLDASDYLEQSSMDEYITYRSLYFQKN